MKFYKVCSAILVAGAATMVVFGIIQGNIAFALCSSMPITAAIAVYFLEIDMRKEAERLGINRDAKHQDD